MRLLYSLGIYVYITAIRVASWFEPKARKWIKGRKHLFEELKPFLSDPKPIAWFHCASLGEYEQGRPVMEAFRKKYPGYRILLTFFSPSGYEIRKNTHLADQVCYIPADTPANARRFVSMVKPKLAVFIKYELWFNFIAQFSRQGIPFYVLSANFRPGQFFFRWYGKWYVKNLQLVTHFFVQNRNSADLLKAHGINQVTVTGDTRFDRVAGIAREPVSLPLIEKFIESWPEVIVAGSTWPPDEDLLARLLKENPGKLKLIIAPHEVHESHLKDLESKFGSDLVRFSQADDENITGKSVMIIDSIGMLSKLYRFGRYAYVGGGFGAGIHNILEAAVYGIPVIFGPNHQKFAEALELSEYGGAFGISNYSEFSDVMKTLSNPKQWQSSANAAKTYIKERIGATEKVMSLLKIS